MSRPAEHFYAKPLQNIASKSNDAPTWETHSMASEASMKVFSGFGKGKGKASGLQSVDSELRRIRQFENELWGSAKSELDPSDPHTHGASKLAEGHWYFKPPAELASFTPSSASGMCGEPLVECQLMTGLGAIVP